MEDPMGATTVLNLIVTGVCALVPSKIDDNLTRVVCPHATHMHVVEDGHAIVPRHVTFLEIPACSFVHKGRSPNFTYHRDKLDRHVFVLRSEQITFATPNTNTDLKRNVARPADDDLTTPDTDEEKLSTVY